AMRGQDLSRGEVRQYKHCFLKRTAEMNQESNWTQQYHYGILLDNNSLLYDTLGQGVGADSIGEPYTAHAMSHFLDDLHTRGKLTRTILTCMNPADNDMLCSMTGNFQEAGIPGKLQFGMGWWSNAQPGDISEQINALSRFGLLGRSIGVSTGSRSLLSLVRHEYFRRLLCNLLGNDVAKGLLPADIDSLGTLVEDVCYNNAHRFFGF
ncbi:MAG: glucuronate isomerase, partial [Prevotella sp.]